MTAVEILGRLNDLGVSVRVNGNKVRVAPVSAVPGELLAEAKAHKQELIDELTVTYGDGQSPPLDRPPATNRTPSSDGLRSRPSYIRYLVGLGHEIHRSG